MTVIVSFTWDDAAPTQMEIADNLEQRGYRGTFYISIAGLWFGMMGGTFGPVGMRELYTRGHDIACHTFAHSIHDRSHLANVSTGADGGGRTIAADIEYGRDIVANELRQLNDYREDSGITFCYPWGPHTAETTGFLRDAGFQMSRNNGGGPDTLPPYDPYAVNSPEMGNIAVVYQAPPGVWWQGVYNRLVEITNEAEQEAATTGNVIWLQYTGHILHTGQVADANSTNRQAFFEYLDELVRRGYTSDPDTSPSGNAVMTAKDAWLKYCTHEDSPYRYQSARVSENSLTIPWGINSNIPTWYSSMDQPTPPWTLSTDSSAGTIGFEFELTQPGFLTGYQFGSHAAVGTAADRKKQFVLYEVTGPSTYKIVEGSQRSYTQMARGLLNPDMSASTYYMIWNRIPVGTWHSRVPLVPGRRYRAAVWDPGGSPWYVQQAQGSNIADLQRSRGMRAQTGRTNNGPYFYTIPGQNASMVGNYLMNPQTSGIAYPDRPVNPPRALGFDVEISRQVGGLL